jgi:hypothetical protein
LHLDVLRDLKRITFFERGIGSGSDMGVVDSAANIDFSRC